MARAKKPFRMIRKALIKKIGGMQRGQGRKPGLGEDGGKKDGGSNGPDYPKDLEFFQTLTRLVTNKLYPDTAPTENYANYLVYEALFTAMCSEPFNWDDTTTTFPSVSDPSKETKIVIPEGKCSVPFNWDGTTATFNWDGTTTTFPSV